MKPDATPKAELAQPASRPAAPPTSPNRPADLGIVERRKVVRTIPAPLAVESDGDTDWAVFQALISDKPPS